MMEPAAVVSHETEVMAKAKRRTFSAKEKLRILQLAEESKKTGEVGAMLGTLQETGPDLSVVQQL